MLWTLSYIDKCVFSDLADVTPGVADGMATVVIVVYFNLSSGVFNRPPSHTCGRWYLPKFFLRDRLLVLMYIDSFIVLVRV